MNEEKLTRELWNSVHLKVEITKELEINVYKK